MAADRDFGHYPEQYCGGILLKSGKGAGPRHGEGQRHQLTLAYPAWGGKKGTDVYFSSRWDNWYQIFDWYWTPKNMAAYSWQTRPWEWVFVQELPYDEWAKDFVWSKVKDKNRNFKKLRAHKNQTTFHQKAKYYAGR